MMESSLHEHKFKVGQSVSFVSGPFGRGGTNGVYKATQLLPPEGDDRQYRIKNADEPHERSLGQAGWIALRDRGTAALGCRESEIMTFDYCSPAELFTVKRKGGSRQRLGYRRFATAAEAIRFAVEEFPAMRTLGAWMLVGEERFDSEEIHRLYESDDYPLGRETG